MATDLPEPVVPATSRCGILARSAITGSPPMVLPSATASLALDVSKSRAADHLAEEHHFAHLVGQFDADGVAARHHGHAGGDRAHRAGDIVSQADDARGLDARRGLQFVKRDDGPGRTWMMLPLTPKSSSTPSRMRAFCSSTSLESEASLAMLFGSASSSIGGRSKPSWAWFGTRSTRAGCGRGACGRICAVGSGGAGWLGAGCAGERRRRGVCTFCGALISGFTAQSSPSSSSSSSGRMPAGRWAPSRSNGGSSSSSSIDGGARSRGEQSAPASAVR